MLEIARQNIERAGLNNCTFKVADNANLPVGDDRADLTIEGWSFAHSAVWYQDDWKQVIGAALDEMARITRAGGYSVLIETMGTGTETPMRPPGLAPLYRWLEEQHDYQHDWIRMDYQFNSVEQMADLMNFFFRDEIMVQSFVSTKSTHVPECAGIWWKQIEKEG
jgi:ubiquinone/menaquinone biosynthesis C-methylase UbiE